jgi:acetyl esterase/lipase
MRLTSLVLALLACTTAAVAADTGTVIPLWPNGAPGSESRKTEPEKINPKNGAVSNIHNPTLTVYLPPSETATGCAVIVIPGGGHRFLTIESEGTAVGKWLAAHGIAAFVLKHRLGLDESNPPGQPQPYKWDEHGVADGQRAMRLVRSRAKEWGINANAIGMVGFSAGGEIVARTAMLAAAGQAGANDPIERESSRADFQGLVYPGKSNLIVPTKDSPPAFLACGFNDRKDISEGLAEVYLRFKQAGVPTDYHVFAGAGHGFGYRENSKAAWNAWPERFREFLVDRKYIAAPKS